MQKNQKAQNDLKRLAKLQVLLKAHKQKHKGSKQEQLKKLAKLQLLLNQNKPQNG